MNISSENSDLKCELEEHRQISSACKSEVSELLEKISELEFNITNGNAVQEELREQNTKLEMQVIEYQKEIEKQKEYEDMVASLAQKLHVRKKD